MYFKKLSRKYKVVASIGVLVGIFVLYQNFGYPDPVDPELSCLTLEKDLAAQRDILGYSDSQSLLNDLIRAFRSGSDDRFDGLMDYARDISNDYYRGAFAGTPCEEMMRVASVQAGTIRNRGGGGPIFRDIDPIRADDYLVTPNIAIPGGEQ